MAVVRNKYLATTIGPEGFGIYGLLNSFFSMISVFAGIWIATGTTKYIAEYSGAGDNEKKNQVFTFAFVVTVLIGGIITATLIFGQSFFRSHFLSKDVLMSYYLLFAAGFIGMNLRPVLLSVLQGVLAVRIVVKYRILISVIDVLLIVVLVYLFQLLGYFIGILISALFSAGILYFYVYKRSGFKFRKVSLNGNIAKRMIFFGGINFLTGLMNLGSAYLQRFLLVNRMGIDSVGIFQAGFAIMNYMGLVNRGSSFHLFPTMSKTMDNDHRVKQLNEYLNFILLIIIPIAVAGILFGRIGIHILFSSKFLPLASYLFWFISAQCIMSVTSAFQLTVVGMARLGIHSLAVFVIHSLWVVIPFFLISKYGIASFGIGFLAGGIAGGGIYYSYLWKKIGLRLSRRVISLMCYGSIALLVSIFSRGLSVIWQIILILCIIGAMLFFLNTEERKKLSNVVQKKLFSSSLIKYLSNN